MTSKLCQLREIIRDATRERSKGSDLDMLREIGRGMQLGAACPSGQNAANLVLSSLEKFPEEHAAHMKRRLCRALLCDSYVTLHILPDFCDGCGECLDACPEGAIEGGKGKIHVIDQDSCDKCGTCYQVCAGLPRATKPNSTRRLDSGPWSGGFWIRFMKSVLQAFQPLVRIMS
jgi:NAD-dependent dihydropyrimidine dehydrogenase PreA subunit